MSYTFTAYGLPTLNEAINVERTNRYAAAKIKKEWTDAVAYEVLQAIGGRKAPVLEHIFVYLQYCQPDARTDKDNVVFQKKYILDGMQTAGLLKNDGWNNVDGWFEETAIIERCEPHVLVCVYDTDTESGEFVVKYGRCIR